MYNFSILRDLKKKNVTIN